MILIFLSFFIFSYNKCGPTLIAEAIGPHIKKREKMEKIRDKISSLEIMKDNYKSSGHKP